MNKEHSAALWPAATSTTRLESWLRNASIVMAGSALVAVCAHAALPLIFTPVPLTLGPFAVLLLGLLLSPRLAAATLGAYLLEGAAGLPVFAPGPAAMSGIAHLLGPTGGYLLAYPAAAWLISLLFRRAERGLLAGLGSAAAGNLLILSCGALWFALVTHAPFSLVLTQTVLPFLPGDALKIAAAAGIAAGASRLQGKRT
jgi:biotin transport system substrate-specific component